MGSYCVGDGSQTPCPAGALSCLFLVELSRRCARTRVSSRSSPVWSAAARGCIRQIRRRHWLDHQQLFRQLQRWLRVPRWPDGPEPGGIHLRGRKVRAQRRHQLLVLQRRLRVSYRGLEFRNEHAVRCGAVLTLRVVCVPTVFGGLHLCRGVTIGHPDAVLRWDVLVHRSFNVLQLHCRLRVCCWLANAHADGVHSRSVLSRRLVHVPAVRRRVSLCHRIAIGDPNTVLRWNLLVHRSFNVLQLHRRLLMWCRVANSNADDVPGRSVLASRRGDVHKLHGWLRVRTRVADSDADAVSRWPVLRRRFLGLYRLQRGLHL
jgi:hypothetical protein